ncbi:hypothetical protein B9Z55_023165 [Caenorhabditis nigoni]|uniref:Chromo domain-containing protein n=1 Tax=Caenorhabditis nigoni TaxID=1611254 RepID=A0A2G5SNL2_9PELO|nr:hypothetical protein B9Z55_023165 [Caenorhabditis nigoni]
MHVHKTSQKTVSKARAKPVIKRAARSFTVLTHQIIGEYPQFRIKNGKRISWQCEFRMTGSQRAILEAYRQKCRNVQCDEDADYTVNRIMDDTTVHGTRWLLVEFVGFEEPFWRYWKRESELADCQEMVQEYEESQGKTKVRQVVPSTNNRSPLQPPPGQSSSKRHAPIHRTSPHRSLNRLCPIGSFSPMKLRSSTRLQPIQKPPSTRLSPRCTSTRRSSTRRWSTKLATINHSSEPSPMSLYDLPGEASSSHVDLISPIGPSSSQFFCHMVDDEIRQIGEQYGAPKRLLPISPWSSQCLANYRLSQHSQQSCAENKPQNWVPHFSPIEATSSQCLSDVPSPIATSSSQRLLDIVKQIDSLSSERSSGTANNESSQIDDRNEAPNRCSPIKTMPSQTSPVGLLPCKPFSSPQSVFEFSPMKVQRLSDASPPLKTTPSQNPSNSLPPNEASFSCSDEKVLTEISCEFFLSPTKPLSDKRVMDMNVPLQPSSSQDSPKHHFSLEPFSSQHVLSDLPGEKIRQVQEQNKPVIVHDRKKYGAPLKRKRMPDGSYKTIPWIKSKGYVETPTSSNIIHRPSPDSHLPLKPSPKKRFSSRQILMIRRSERRVYRQQLSNDLSDKEDRKVREAKRASIVNDRTTNTSVPLKRIKLADGTWKTLKWIKPKGDVQSSHSS